MQNDDVRMKKDNVEDCHGAALRLLQYRWRGEHELDERLRRRGFDPQVVRQVIDRLREEKWLDDRRFAAEFARTRRSRHLGRHRIARELQSLGVDRADASAATQSSPEEERQNLIVACQKRIRALSRLRGMPFVSGAEGRRKLAAYLLRQGYDYGDVLAVVEEELSK